MCAKQLWLHASCTATSFVHWLQKRNAITTFCECAYELLMLGSVPDGVSERLEDALY